MSMQHGAGGPQSLRTSQRFSQTMWVSARSCRHRKEHRPVQKRDHREAPPQMQYYKLGRVLHSSEQSGQRLFFIFRDVRSVLCYLFKHRRTVEDIREAYTMDASRLRSPFLPSFGDALTEPAEVLGGLYGVVVRALSVSRALIHIYRAGCVTR